MIDYTTMTSPEMREACGTDAGKWAAAFMQYVQKHGPGYVNERQMIGWFANAIMNAHDAIEGDVAVG